MATLLAGPVPLVSEQEATVPWPQGGDTAGEIASQTLTDECSGGFFLSDEVAVTGESRWSGRVTSEGRWGASEGQGVPGRGNSKCKGPEAGAAIGPVRLEQSEQGRGR